MEFFPPVAPGGWTGYSSWRKDKKFWQQFFFAPTIPPSKSIGPSPGQAAPVNLPFPVIIGVFIPGFHNSVVLDQVQVQEAEFTIGGFR